MTVIKVMCFLLKPDVIRHKQKSVRVYVVAALDNDIVNNMIQMIVEIYRDFVKKNYVSKKETEGRNDILHMYSKNVNFNR